MHQSCVDMVYVTFSTRRDNCERHRTTLRSGTCTVKRTLHNACLVDSPQAITRTLAYPRCKASAPRGSHAGCLIPPEAQLVWPVRVLPLDLLGHIALLLLACTARLRCARYAVSVCVCNEFSLPQLVSPCSGFEAVFPESCASGSSLLLKPGLHSAVRRRVNTLLHVDLFALSILCIVRGRADA